MKCSEWKINRSEQYVDKENAMHKACSVQSRSSTETHALALTSISPVGLNFNGVISWWPNRLVSQTKLIVPLYSQTPNGMERKQNRQPESHFTMQNTWAVKQMEQLIKGKHHWEHSLSVFCLRVSFVHGPNPHLSISVLPFWWFYLIKWTLRDHING